VYKTILVPLDRSAADQTILDHIRPLARLMGSRLVLVHIAEGHAARNQDQLNLADSQEITEGRAYLAGRQAELAAEGLAVESHLGRGDAATQLLERAGLVRADLIAMSTHGHRFLADVVLGSVADSLRHRTDIPILLIRARRE
jgi:nucleotide-binding universal stress UspA family protein